MPKLWDETIEAHRRTVRDATLDAAAALVAEQGLRSVTMSEIAERTGIGRATLYKYFPGVEAILAAWHARQVSSHLERLAEVRDQAQGASERLEAVLVEYARIQSERMHHHDRAHGGDLAALLHRDQHVLQAEQRLHNMIQELLEAAIATGGVRDDVPAPELAHYCLHALQAVTTSPTENAMRRLVTVILAGLYRPR